MVNLSASRFSLTDLTLITTAAVGVRYFLFAGVAWVLGYVWLRQRWRHRKIIGRDPGAEDVWREIRHSMLSILIFGLVGAATVYASRLGWTRLYWNIESRGWPWFWGSIGCAILLHDTYFYWTHRLMHHRLLFPLVHRTHHLSRNPTPWAAYSFSPLEAVAQAGIFPLIAFAMPIHPLAMGLFMMWQIFFNVIGHTGYEFHHRSFMDSWARLFVNTPTNHVMHHEKTGGNYGLYFNFWDRLMGTNHADYERRFREVVAQGKEVEPQINAN